MLPTRVQLDRKTGMTLAWPDGRVDAWTVAQLRAACPCAACKETRARADRLAVVADAGGGGPLAVESVERVGNYALRLAFTDGHATGLYSFAHLRASASPA